jgi:two-component system nitrate/nitrite response regulator NarL
MPDANVVATTLMPGRNAALRSFEAGACAYVPNTREADELLQVVRSAAMGRVTIPWKSLASRTGNRGPAGTASRHGGHLADPLTPRQMDILQALANGDNTAQIARKLFMTELTVRSHIKAILPKLGVHSRIQAVLVAARRGLIRPSFSDDD